MVVIFTRTTSMLGFDFVQSFPADKLSLTLARVKQDTGVHFNEDNKAILIEGHWEAMTKAYTALEFYLNDQISYRDSFQSGNVIPPKGHKNKTPRLVVSGTGKPGRKPGCTVGSLGNDINSLPKPFVVMPGNQNSFHLKQESDTQNDFTVASSDDSEKSSNIIIQQLVELKEQMTTADKEYEEIKREKILEPNVTNDNAYLTDIEYDDIDVDDECVDENSPIKLNSSNNDSDVQQSEIVTIKSEPTEAAEQEVDKESKKSRRKCKPPKFVQSDVGVDGETDSENDNKTLNSKISKRKAKKQSKVKLKKQKVTKIKKKRQKTIEDDEEHKCDKCDYVGKLKKHLTEHFRRAHTSKFFCDECPKQFGFNKDLNRHKRQVHGQPSHFCDICSKAYKSKRVFDEHVLSHKADYVKPSFDCDICGKSYTTKYVLAKHVKEEHLGIRKSYVCPTCGRSFTQKNSYVMHANVHAGIKPYVCDICGVAFTYDKSLKEHKFMHDNIRRFKCDICSKTFRQTTSLRIHMKVHKDTKDYMCTSCGKGFTQKQALLRHERIHSGDKPYSCRLCARTFNDYSIIRRHMMLIHKRDPKNWRGDILSNLKRTKEYYIDGGPGHPMQSLRNPSDAEEDIPAYKLPEKNPHDDTVKQFLPLSIPNLVVKAKTVPAPDVKDESLRGSNLGQNISQTNPNASQPVFPGLNTFTAEYIQKIGMPQINTDEKVQEAGMPSVTSMMPINYSVPAIYSDAHVPSTTAPDHDNSNTASRYHDSMEAYNSPGAHRDLITLNPAITTIPEQLRNVQTVVSVSGDVTQTQASNFWGFPGYQAYYSQANFPHYPGPQS